MKRADIRFDRAAPHTLRSAPTPHYAKGRARYARIVVSVLIKVLTLPCGTEMTGQGQTDDDDDDDDDDVQQQYPFICCSPPPSPPPAKSKVKKSGGGGGGVRMMSQGEWGTFGVYGCGWKGLGDV